MRALLPAKEPESVLFQCLFLKRLPETMSDAVLAAGLDNIEDMAAMADRLHDKPAASAVSAIAAQPPCCAHVSAIDNQKRNSNRSGRSGRSGRSPNRSTRSPDKRAATPGPDRGGAEWYKFKAAGFPSNQCVPGAKNDWCGLHQFFGAKAQHCVPPCTFPGN